MIEMKAAILPQRRNPFRKFPVAALLGLLAAMVFLLQLSEQGSEDFSLSGVVVALQVAFIGSVAATIIARMGGVDETLCHIASLCVAGVFFGLSFIVIPQSLYLVVIGGFGLALVTCAPCFYQRSQIQVWWHVLHVLMAAFLSLVVFAFWLSAFYTIEWMVQTLFVLGMSLTSVRDLVPGLGLALAFLFFLSALPAGTRADAEGQEPLQLDERLSLSGNRFSDKKRGETKTETRFTEQSEGKTAVEGELEVYIRALFDFLLVPIIFIAGLVLHFYAAVILLRQAFPDGQIGKIVTLYVCLIVAVRFLAYPFLPRMRLQGRIFCRIWALLLVVPLALLLVAVSLRSGQYGMTIHRYYLYVGSCAIIIIMLAQILPRWRHDIRLLLLIPSGLLIASVFGPWSVQNWVGISQADYLIRTYERQGRLNFSSIQLYDASYHDLAQHINLLDETGQLSRLLPYIEKDNKIANQFIMPDNLLPGRRPNYETFMQALGATPPPTMMEQGHEPNTLRQAFAFGELFANRGPVVSVETYDKIVPFLFVSSRAMERGVNYRQFVTMRIEDEERLTLRYRDISDIISLREFMVLATSLPSGGARSFQPVDLRSEGGRHLRLLPLEIHVDAEGMLKSLNISLMLREEEWLR